MSTIPKASDFPLYKGINLTNNDWNSLIAQIVTMVTNGNYEFDISKLTATTILGDISGATGFPTYDTILTAGENISDRDLVRQNGSLAYRATGTSDAGVTNLVGFARGSASSGNPVTIRNGYIAGLSGLTPGAIYYVGTTGAITASVPASRIVPVGYAQSATVFVFKNYFNQSTSNVYNISAETISSPGALNVTPLAGTNLNVNLSTTGDFVVNTNQLYIDTSTSRVGIGTATPLGILHISDTMVTGSPSIYFTCADTGAINLIFGGTTHNNYGQIIYSDSSNSMVFKANNATALTLSSTGGIAVSGVISSTGAATFSSTIAVTGAATLSSTIAVTGAATFSSTLAVTGASTFSSTIGVTGATTLSSTLAVTGATTLTGATSVGSTLSVTGNLSVNTNRFVVNASTGDINSYGAVFSNTGGGSTANVLQGSTVLSNGVDAGANGTYLNMKVLNIGDWNMDTTAYITIAHGLTLSKIICAIGSIRGDDAVSLYDLFPADDTAPGQGGYVFCDVTNVYIHRITGGFFDNASFDSTSFNRGFIYINYKT